MAAQQGGRWPAGSRAAGEKPGTMWMEQADLPGPRRRLRREGDGERAPEGGGEKPHAGRPASGAPPPPFAAGPSASAWAGHSLKMSWGWGGTWDGWGPRRGWLQGRHVGPSPPGPRPPSHSLDGHSANPASPRAVKGSLPEARPGARRDTKCAFSNSEPVDQQTPASRDGLLHTRHHRHTAYWAGGPVPAGHNPAPPVPSPGQDPPGEGWCWRVPLTSRLPSPPQQEPPEPSR